MFILLTLTRLLPVFLFQHAGAQRHTTSPQQCVDNSQSASHPQSFYHAPARNVPVPPVDPAIKREFLLLFHRDLNHTHGTPHDSNTQESMQPSPIDPAIIAEINSLCARDAFFYSFAPRHQRAIMLLQQVFMAVRSPRALAQLARSELYRHEINSRVWYYALLATVLMRPDLNGYYLAWALDATPDLYIPESILNKATEGSSRPQLVPAQGPCETQQLVQPEQVRVRQPGQSNQFPRPGQSNQFSRPGQSNQFSRPGQSNQFRQPGHSDQFPQPGQYQEFRQPGQSVRFPQHGQSQQSSQRGQSQQSSQRGQSQQFPQPGQSQQFPQPGQSQQFPQPGQSQQFPQPGQSQQLRQPGQSQHFPQPGQSQQFPQPGQSQQLRQPGQSQRFPQPGQSQQFPQSGQSQQFFQSGESDQFPQPGQYQEFRHPEHSQQHHHPEQSQQYRQPEQSDQFHQPGQHEHFPQPGQTIIFRQPVQQQWHGRKKRQVYMSSLHHGQGPIRRTNNNKNCLLYDGTKGATDAAENKLWYFREDVMLNQHHWYWHQYYPQSAVRNPDRRGEVFYFVHHNIIARYNAERLSNGLPQETALDLRRDGNIGTGYNSGLVDKQSERLWTPRVGNTLLSDINHQNDPDFQLNVTMDEISRLYSTLVSHIGEGFLLANQSRQQGQPPMEFQLPIRNQEGLSHLGNTIEAAENLSVHANFYHSYGIHNLGHISVALSSDPDFSCQRPTGVMADLTVTMRDPAFYKVHTFVDDLFDQYKSTLQPYHPTAGEWPLNWEGVRIQSLELLAGKLPNHVKTFWSTRRFPLEEGLDGSIHDGDVNVDICHLHLNHEPFQFRLTVDVNGCFQSRSSRGTVRIFMAPRYDLNGRRFSMSETRRLMFQLDSFPVELRRGRNVITRNSQDSSSTKPWARNLQEMRMNPDNGGKTEYCGCGWPDHLYLPKGTPQGMEYDLFAMITNFDQDQVQDTAEDLRIPEPCHSPSLFCGIPYRKYPDARPLGYPFDRLPYSVVDNGRNTRPVNSLEEFVAHVPNMKASVVTVQHVDFQLG